MQNRLLLLLILVAFPFLGSAQNSLRNEQTLVVATYQYGDNPRLKNLEPYANYLSEVTGLKTEVKSYPSVQLLLQAMVKGEADVVFMNTFGYLILREQNSSFETLAVLQLPEKEASTYRTIIVSPRENHIRSLQDGIDRAPDNLLILVNPGSTSGNLVPRLKLSSLMESDPEMSFLEVQYAGTHKQALDNMFKEKFAIAACGYEEFYKLGADTSKVDVLWKSQSMPLGPVVCKKNISNSVKELIKQSLLELHNTNVDALQAIKEGWVEALPAEKFVPLDDSYYDSLIKMAGDPDRAMRIIKRFTR